GRARLLSRFAPSEKITDTSRKGEPTESTRRSPSTRSRALGERSGKILIGQLGHPHRHGRPIGENEGWPERDPGARIVSAHDRGHVVAADEQARNRFADFAQYPTVRVGPQTHAGSQRARIHGHRVIGRRLDAAEAWIRCLVRIAIVAVELGRAFAELLVLARVGKAIVFSPPFAETRPLPANLAGKHL